MVRIDQATFGLIVATAVLGGLGLILALASIVAVIFGREAMRGWVQQEARVTASTSIGQVIARMYLNMSYMEWVRVTRESKQIPIEKGLSLAIRLGEAALKNAELAGDQERIAIAKSNLAYYFAQEQLANKKEVAMEFARFGKESFAKFPARFTLLANDVYVRMRYAEQCDVSTLAPLKKYAEDLAHRFPDLKIELEEYVAEMKEKCPSLSEGASR